VPYLCICLTTQKVPVAIAHYSDGLLRPKRVFNL
jgi:hypothetical protein